MSFRVRKTDNRAAIMAAIRKGTLRGLKDVADKVVEEAVARVRVNSGNLQRSIQAGLPQDRGNHIAVTVGAHAPYAAAVEWGTAGRGEPVGSQYKGKGPWPSSPPGKKAYGPYKIRPRTRQFLSWVGPDGQRRFAREVTHPGVEARPYFRPALDVVLYTGVGMRLLRDAIRAELAKVRNQDAAPRLAMESDEDETGEP